MGNQLLKSTTAIFNYFVAVKLSS